MMSIFLKKNFLFLLIGIFSASVIPGQTNLPEEPQIEITDTELEKFAKAYQNIRMANQEFQQKMTGIVQQEKMEVSRFNEIYKAKVENKPVEANPQELK